MSSSSSLRLPEESKEPEESEESEEEIEGDLEDSDDSEMNYIPEIEMDAYRQVASTSANQFDNSDLEEDLFADEPRADPEWTARYEKQVQADEELKEKLQYRLDSTTPVNEW